MADLNYDGKYEVCANVLFGFGIVDERIKILDIQNKHSYEMSKRFEYDLVLDIDKQAKTLVVYKNGNVFLGKLELIDEVLSISEYEQVKPPTFSPNGGAFRSDAAVTISCETTDAVIYYSLNDSTVETKYTAPITLNATTTISARAVKAGMTDSDSITVIFTKQNGSTGGGSSILPPTASLKGGTVAAETKIELTASYKNGKIYYTTDGTTPTKDSLLYTESIIIDKTTSVKYIVVVNGQSSAVTSQTYTVENAGEQPKIKFKSGTANSFGNFLDWNWIDGVIGYRVYRSERKGTTGNSVTDFYLSEASFIDKDITANTTYYYTVCAVIGEARPSNGIKEQLGEPSEQFTLKSAAALDFDKSTSNTGQHLIIMQLNNPRMTVDGEEREIDPRRGTVPILLNNRTLVPIRAIVEAMGARSVGTARHRKYI